MADDKEYYRETSLKRFTNLGLIILLVLVGSGFLLKYLADQQISADGRDAMGLLRGEGVEDAPRGRSGPLVRFQAETPAGMPVDERIRRWRQAQESRTQESRTQEPETTGSVGVAPPAPAPRP